MRASTAAFSAAGGGRLRTACRGLFERLDEQLGGGSWLIGRVSGSEYAKAEAYPDSIGRPYPREPWFARRHAAARRNGEHCNPFRQGIESSYGI